MNVRIQQSPIHGRGVFANESIQAGDWQYMYGDLRIVLPGDIHERYGVEWDEERKYMPFAPWCCLNHSNTPNCEIEELEGHPMLTVTALRNIELDEELTIDYGHEPKDD